MMRMEGATAIYKSLSTKAPVGVWPKLDRDGRVDC